MTTSRHQAHDQLLARVNLTERRLARLVDDLEADQDLGDSELAARATELSTRCSALAERIRSWTEIQIGATTAVEDLAAAVDTMESDLAAARATEPEGYEEAVDRQIRNWRTRIDRLRLHGELATMEVRDELDELAEKLETARGNVLADLRTAVGDAKQTVIDLRNGVEEVVVDVRKTVEHAASSLTRD